jgi:hypothetical protein
MPSNTSVFFPVIRRERERERERNRGLKMDKWNNLLRLPKGVCQGLPDFS